MFLILAFSYSWGVYGTPEEDIPKVLLFFGRFHPVVLHLPIGALLLTFVIDIVGRFRNNYNASLIKTALGFSSLFSILAAVLGYFLSLEGGYGENILQTHMWAGFGMTLLVCVLYLAKKIDKGILKKMYMPLFMVTILLTVFTGHYGSILTHGDTFLTVYSPLNSTGEKEIITEKDSLYYFQHVISPILEDKCISCHNSNKTKGELNLSTVSKIKEGGEHGEIYVAGNSEESTMYKALMLPIKEKEHMPPTGKPQLTMDEIWLIKHWIDTGANFTEQIVNYQKNDTLLDLLTNYLIFPKEDIDEASASELRKIMSHGFVVSKVIFGQPYLRATYSSAGRAITSKDMRSLIAISDQLVELNLQESKLTDEVSGSLRKLKSLKSLRLDQTMITDRTLDFLKELSSLEVLNLFNTEITTEGLTTLLNFIAPEKVYFWNKNANNEKFSTVTKGDKRTTILQGLQEGFIEKSTLAKPIVLGNKTIFDKEIKIEVEGRLKGEKIYYSLDGKEPDSTSLLYKEPIVLGRSAQFKAKSYKEGWYSSEVISIDYSKIKYIIKNVSVKYPPEESYAGVHKVFDLERGSVNFRDGKWNGYLDDFVATLDMGEEIEINQLSVNCLEGIGSYIFFPSKIEVYAGNEPGSMKKFEQRNLPPTDRDREIKIKNFSVDLSKVKARYIKVVLKNIKKLPSWHEGAGADAWIFVDEIMVQ
jgi:uncharacterized membrane protein